VDTLRDSTSHQLQNTALLLVSGLATWVPDVVLHSVMPIFAFMGNTILRQGDDYSAHVVDQTVSHVIPPLVASLKKKSRQVTIGVSDVLLSFVAAFEHIPSHRRLALFEKVVTTIGAEDCLFAIAVMLFDRYPTDSRARNFVADLFCAYGPETALQVSTTVVIHEDNTDEFQAINQAIETTAELFRPRKDLAEALLNLRERSSEQLAETASSILNAFNDLLNNNILHSRIVRLFNSEKGAGESQFNAFSELMQTSIRLNNQVKSTAAGKLKSLIRVFC
jgi:U3 small nucleolar RNA-associated protein 10